MGLFILIAWPTMSLVLAVPFALKMTNKQRALPSARLRAILWAYAFIFAMYLLSFIVLSIWWQSGPND